MKVELLQGSPEWLEFRTKRIGGSDVPIIMRRQLEWNTPYTLFLDKLKIRTGKDKPSQNNWAIDRGNKFEAAARARYELYHNISLPPTILVHPEHSERMASLDGYNEDAKRVLEIKVPGREVFDLAKAGKVHSKYEPQLEWQLYVSEAEEVHFFCCKVERVNGAEKIVDDALVIYKSNPELKKEMLDEVSKFWECVTSGTPPALCSKDTLTVTDLETKAKFSELEVCKLELDQLESKAKEVKKRFEELKSKALVSLPHDNVRVGRLKILKIVSKGRVDYAKIPALQSLKDDDLAAYRSPDVVSYKVEIVD